MWKSGRSRRLAWAQRFFCLWKGCGRSSTAHPRKNLPLFAACGCVWKLWRKSAAAVEDYVNSFGVVSWSSCPGCSGSAAKPTLFKRSFALFPQAQSSLSAAIAAKCGKGGAFIRKTVVINRQTRLIHSFCRSLAASIPV